MKKKIILDIIICTLIVVMGVYLRSIGRGMDIIPTDLRDSFLDESGTPYLADTDSYLYLRYAEEIADGAVKHDFSREQDPLMTTAYKMTEDSDSTYRRRFWSLFKSYWYTNTVFRKRCSRKL